MSQEDKRHSNLKLLEEIAQALGDQDIKRLEAFAAFLRRYDKSRVLELDLWAVNDELVKAGIDPTQYPSMAAAVRAAIGKRTDGEIDKLAEVGAAVALDVIKGWRREPIPFDRKVVKYQIEKLLARALKEMK